MKRLDYFDMAKGIGIFLVVLGHSTFIDGRIITWIFSFHMPLFFIISGMLICHKNEAGKPFKDLLIRKAKSILIPYLVFSICYTVIDFISVYFQQISLHDLKINAACTLSLAGSGPLWFLPSLMICELLFVFILKKCGHKYGLALSFVLSCVSMLIWHFFEPVFTTYKSNLLYFFFMNIPFVVLRSVICLVFMAGAYVIFELISKLNIVAKKVTSKYKWGSIWELSIGLVLSIVNVPLSFLNTNIDMHNLGIGKPHWFVICAFLGSVGLLLICKNMPSLKLITFWGRNSLVIMVTHLNFYLLYLGGKVAFALNPYIPRAKEYIFLFNVVATAMLVASIMAILINRFCPWILGKPNCHVGDGGKHAKIM